MKYYQTVLGQRGPRNCRIFFSCITFFAIYPLNIYSCESMSCVITQRFFQINCSSFINHEFIVHLLHPVGALFASCKRLFFTVNNRSPNSVYIQGLYINQISKIQKKKLPERILNLISINIKFNIHLYIFDINWALFF